MSTREKIIVGAMCLTILYGAYELFGSGANLRKQPPVQKNPVEELRNFVVDIGQKLIAQEIADEYEYMIAKAGDDWTKDPFIHSSVPLKALLTIEKVDTPPKTEAKQPDFLYTGYLSLGKKKLAIINGMEYVEGEGLDFKGYYVKSIAPRHVVVANIDGMESFQLPLREVE